MTRRAALQRASAFYAMAVLGTKGSLPVTSDRPGKGQDSAKQAARAVGVDPHGAPNPNERHALITVRDNLFRYEVGEGRSQHSALLLVTDAGIILTDPIQTSGAIWLRDELKKRFNKP